MRVILDHLPARHNDRSGQQDGGSTQISATKLEVLAIATPWQGRRFHTAERASDIMMPAVMTTPHQPPVSDSERP
jgi:hypothetical protein